MYALTKNLNGGGYVRTVDLHQSFQLNSLTINTFFPESEWDGNSAGWRGKKRRKYESLAVTCNDEVSIIYDEWLYIYL